MQPTNKNVTGQPAPSRGLTAPVTVHVTTGDAQTGAGSTKRVLDMRVEAPLAAPVAGRASVVPKRPRMQPLPDDLQAARGALANSTTKVLEAVTPGALLDSFCLAAIEFGRFIVARVTLPEDVVANKDRLMNFIENAFELNPDLFKAMREDLVVGFIDAVKTLVADKEERNEFNAYNGARDELDARERLHDEITRNPLSLIGLDPATLVHTLARLDPDDETQQSIAMHMKRMLGAYQAKISAANARLRVAQRLLQALEGRIEAGAVNRNDAGIQSTLGVLRFNMDKAVADIGALQTSRRRRIEQPLENL